MKKHINIAGVEVRTSTVIIASVLLLFIVAMLLVRAVRGPAPAPAPTEPPTAAPTEEPTPTPVPPTPTPEPTEKPTEEPTEAPSVEVVGEWVGTDDAIGTAYLGVCNGFSTVYTRLYPVPDDLVKAAGEAYPDLPDLQVVAVSNPMYIPNTGTGEVHDDIDATLMSEAFPECEKSPWSEEAVQAVLNTGEPLGFFGIARPVIRDGESLWEIVVYAIVWTQ